MTVADDPQSVSQHRAKLIVIYCHRTITIWYSTPIVKENNQHGMPVNKGDADNSKKNLALALLRLHGIGLMKHCVCESGMSLTALAETPHRLRCIECGSIWYRTDPKARAEQGRKGARKRWKGHKSKAQARQRNGKGGG